MTLYRCTRCQHTLFPARLLCPACGSNAWETIACDTGHVEAVTAIHRSDEAVIHLASVRTPQGVVVLARLAHGPLDGHVTLQERPDGAVIAGAMENAR